MAVENEDRRRAAEERQDMAAATPRMRHAKALVARATHVGRPIW